MLVVENLSKSYSRGYFKTPVHAVSNVSFNINRGEAFGLMGTNGSGKSTVAHLILRLDKADGGKVLFHGRDLLTLSKKEFSPFRRKIQIIFQQPLQALDPKQTVFNAIAEPLLVHRLVDSNQTARQKVEELLALTNLSDEILDRFPHEISGGQAQRVAIARALSLGPELLIADEPTSMLDISIQAQILTLLKQLQLKHGISILLISHDLSVVRHFCDRMAVLQAGQIVRQLETTVIPN